MEVRTADVQRLLRREPGTGLPGDDAVNRAVPADTWTSWQQARECVAGSVVGDIWSAGGLLDDLAGWAVWARCRAEWLLADAVQRGVLTVQEVPIPRQTAGHVAWLARVAVALRRGGRTARVGA